MAGTESELENKNAESVVENKYNLVCLLFFWPCMFRQIWWVDGPRKTFCPFFNKTGMANSSRAVWLFSNYGWIKMKSLIFWVWTGKKKVSLFYFTSLSSLCLECICVCVGVFDSRWSNGSKQHGSCLDRHRSLQTGGWNSSLQENFRLRQRLPCNRWLTEQQASCTQPPTSKMELD